MAGTLLNRLSSLLSGSRRATRRRLHFAAALAVLLAHGLLLAALVETMGSGKALPIGEGEGQGQERAFRLSLAGLSGAQLARTRGARVVTEVRDDQIEKLFRKLTPIANAEVLILPKYGKSNSIAELFGPEPPTVTQDQSATTALGDEGKGANKAHATGQSNQPFGPKVFNIGKGDGAAAAGTFAASLEQCWRSLPGRSLVPVTLVVSINEQGMFAAPPQVLRPESAQLTTARMASEDRAIRALAKCLPNKAAAREAGRFTLNFFQSGIAHE